MLRQNAKGVFWFWYLLLDSNRISYDDRAIGLDTTKCFLFFDEYIYRILIYRIIDPIERFALHRYIYLYIIVYGLGCQGSIYSIYGIVFPAIPVIY